MWSDAEIIAALRECVRLLAPIAAEVEVSQPVRHEQCGAPAPVLLKRIGSGANKVEISPPAVLNCAMVASLHAWVEKTLQPAAREALGTPDRPPAQRVGLCLPRAQRQSARHRQAERACARQCHRHRRLRHGRRPHHRRGALLGSDGARQARCASSSAKGAKDASRAEKGAGKPEPTKARPVNKKISAIAHRLHEEPPRARKQDARSARKTAAVQRQGKGMSDVSADPKAIPATAAPERENAKKSAESAFLRRLHKGACGVFGTVLGPEANEAHRDHFHFDLATRRRSAFCQ